MKLSQSGGHEQNIGGVTIEQAIDPRDVSGLAGNGQATVIDTKLARGSLADGDSCIVLC